MQLTTEAQGLTNAEGHRVVELESVVQGLVLILRVTVCQVDVIRSGTEVVGRLRLGGAVI